MVANFPGPAFIINSDLAVVTANEQSGELIEALKKNNDGKVARAIQDCCLDRTLSHHSFSFGEEDNVTVFDLTLLPLANRDHQALVTGKDVTMQRNLTNALVASRQLFKDLVTCTAEFVWETDARGYFRYVSPRGAIGYTASELDGRLARKLIIEHREQQSGEEALNPFECRDPVENEILWLEDRTGALACMRISSIPVYDEENNWVGCRGAGHDITGEMAQKTRLEKMAEEEKVFASIIDAIRHEIDTKKLFEIAGEGACQALNSTRILLARKDFNNRFEVMFKAGVHDGVEKCLLNWVRSDGLQVSDNIVELIDGDWRLFVAPILFGEDLDGVIVLIRRIEATELESGEARLLKLLSEHLGVALIQIKAREKLELLSRTDELSGLLNRRAFHDDVAKRLRHNQRIKNSCSLFYIDLDNFKPVNDRFGHEKGDEVLKGISKLLTENTRVGDMVSRLGGDEFAMWLEDISLEEAVEKATEMQVLCRKMSEEMEVLDPSLSFSIGIAFATGEETENLDGLLALADAAMYEVKAKGKGTFSVAGQSGKTGTEDA
ncbi:MAG: sensor domain-containing diguanylate cyclase [Sneathiellales bacterium]|nr:sensor domain-containing diguanylate cyclase [Sneathiellales bacterium]